MKTLLLFTLCLSQSAVAQKQILYAGTFNQRGSEGIYVMEWDKKSLKVIQTIRDAESPNFVTVHPSQKFLYAVNSGSAEADSFGSVSAFAIDENGKLKFINHVSSKGAGPCHISLDNDGKWAFVTNYGDGMWSAFPLQENGALKEAAATQKFTGSSLNKNRQTSSHAHSSYISKSNRLVYICDLGADKIYNLPFDNGKIGTAEETKVKGGAGPRHLAFRGGFAYLAEELTSAVCVLAIDPTTEKLSVIQEEVASLAAVPANNTAADIHLDGKGNLFMSNRGANVLSVFSVGKDGKVKLKGQQPTGGKTPRNFLVTDEFIFVANQDSDNITVFKNSRGQLSSAGISAAVPAAVSLALITLK